MFDGGLDSLRLGLLLDGVPGGDEGGRLRVDLFTDLSAQGLDLLLESLFVHGAVLEKK